MLMDLVSKLDSGQKQIRGKTHFLSQRAKQKNRSSDYYIINSQAMYIKAKLS